MSVEIQTSGASQGSGLPDVQTVNDLFLRIASSNQPKAMQYQDEAGNWQALTANEVYQRVYALGSTFLDWGILRGDRIAILSENRWEWAVTDFATLAIGAVDVPIYPTLTSEQIGELLRDSGSRIIVVSTRTQYDKVEAVRADTPLEHVILMDSAGLFEATWPADAIKFSALMENASGKKDRDPEFDARAQSVKPADLATIIYTSGTTGEPKGVMLTHGNIASNTSFATREFGFGPDDGCISFLPLSHITARALDYAMFFYGASVAYCPKFDNLPAVMKQVRPTVFVGVPRVYEKIRQGVEQKAAASSMKARLLAWAVGLGAGYRDMVHDGQRPSSPFWRLAEKLIYSKVREAFGGRVTTFISGGAPLGIDTGNWFASIGISVLEGYGLTETSPVIAINTPKVHRMGSVGRQLPNVECKLAPDDELLVRGPGIFQGYWQKLVATHESFDEESWFKTGDIARIDGDGFLYITDRKKELLKTSGGKLIAPQPIEGKLKTNLLVGQAALVGDKHKFISVLISPNFAALEDWARQQGITALTRRDLVGEPKVLAIYNDIVAKVNSTLANFETMKRFRLVPDEWAIDTGELTPSMKLKRRVINQRYASLIEDLYADEATAHGE
ncbi:AMP-dependent synthetase/ligase [Acidicapsa dinghuensis]|uniref:AMP-dependent synthetase/ligase n=1 Tax=Acidicapsa dinghuensis TaxID=2218256 RepID=A0ABW1EKT3_9BACT|nr:long-chain fatty acid--CoA ligase [Acidicapsa dinghuensis]